MTLEQTLPSTCFGLDALCTNNGFVYVFDYC